MGRWRRSSCSGLLHTVSAKGLCSHGAQHGLRCVTDEPLTLACRRKACRRSLKDSEGDNVALRVSFRTIAFIISLHLETAWGFSFVRTSLEIILRLLAKHRQYGLVIESGVSCTVGVDQRASDQERIAQHQRERARRVDFVGIDIARLDTRRGSVERRMRSAYCRRRGVNPRQSIAPSRCSWLSRHGQRPSAPAYALVSQPGF